MAKRRSDAKGKGPLFARRDPPEPERHVKHGWGRRQKFVRMLQRNPDQWFQYEPGARHSPSAAAAFRYSFPGIRATTRKRKYSGGWNIFAMWPTTSEVTDEVVDQATFVVHESEVDPEPEQFDWDDFQ